AQLRDALDVALARCKAEPDGYAALLHRARPGMDALEIHGAALEACWGFAPEELADTYLLFEARVAAFPGHARGIVLLLLPPEPEPDAHAPARHHIERRELLGEQHGGSQR